MIKCMCMTIFPINCNLVECHTMLGTINFSLVNNYMDVFGDKIILQPDLFHSIQSGYKPWTVITGCGFKTV